MLLDVIAKLENVFLGTVFLAINWHSLDEWLDNVPYAWAERPYRAKIIEFPFDDGHIHRN